MTSKFDKSILNYARLHPDEPVSAFVLENYQDALEGKKSESKKWRLIADALKNYESYKGDK